MTQIHKRRKARLSIRQFRNTMTNDLDERKRPTLRRRQQSRTQRSLALVFRIFKGSWLTFTMTKGAEASAALAYYTLCSLFPLLIIIVSVGSLFVDKALIEQRLIALLPEVMPVSQDFIIANVRDVFVNRGAITIIAFLGLIWSATAVFTVIMRNINAAWPDAAPRSYLRMRLLSLVLVIALAFLFMFSTFTITFKQLIINLGFGATVESVWSLFSTSIARTVINNLLRILLFFALYYWTPQIKVKKSAAITGALLTALLWQLLSTFFSSYISSGLASYDIVYGSLGKIVALLAWIYFSVYIVLWGAHLTSSMDRHTSS